MYGCISAHQSSAAATSPALWSDRHAAVIDFDNSDTAAVRRTKILVRYWGKTPTDSISLQIRTVTPCDSTRTDTVGIHLPLAPASNDIRLAEHILADGITLPEKGRYRFCITPLSDIKGIWGIGLDFTKTE